jgi:hypothetical protein
MISAQTLSVDVAGVDLASETVFHISGSCSSEASREHIIEKEQRRRQIKVVSTVIAVLGERRSATCALRQIPVSCLRRRSQSRGRRVWRTMDNEEENASATGCIAIPSGQAH